MASLKHHLRKLPKITKSEACSKFLDQNSAAHPAGLQEETERVGDDDSPRLNMETQVTEGTPYSPSCPLLDTSDDDDDMQSASQETVDDEQDVIVTMIVNPLSSYLSDWEFREFLQAWQACDGACARRQDDDDGNDKVEGVKGCLLKSKKSTTRNVFADSLPYSPSCEFEAEARENEDDVVTKLAERRNCDYVVSPDCKNKANSKGDKVARSNNAARTPSCSGSDFDFGGDSPDSIPSSAAALIRNNGVSKVERMGKLNRIERVSSEVKIALYPFFKNKAIDKNEYKYILKGAVTKIYRAKSKPIVHSIIKSFVESYVHKIQIRRNAGRGRF